MTPEEAAEALHKAIADDAVASGLVHDDEILSEWAIISNWQKLDGDAPSRYVTQFTNARVPMHVAAGMFEVAVHAIWEDEA